MPHAFPENFSPIPAHVENDTLFDVHESDVRSNDYSFGALNSNPTVQLRHCGCVVGVPFVADSYGVTATWHFIFATVAHTDCPSELRQHSAVFDPMIFRPSYEEIGRMLRHDDPFQPHVLCAMDGCEIAHLESVCEHGLPSWPLYLDYLPTKWSDVHSLLPKGKEHPDSAK
jgi:hypothetical protein